MITGSDLLDNNGLGMVNDDLRAVWRIVMGLPAYRT